MEPVGLAVGLVGLAGLFKTCLDIIDKIDTFRDFGADSQALSSQYHAYRVCLRKWGQRVGFQDGKLQAKHHSALEDAETAAVVEMILGSIQTIFAKSETAFRELDLQGDTILQRLQTQPASTRAKLKWATMGKARFLAQVQRFGALVDALCKLVSVYGPETLSIDNHGGREVTGGHDQFSHPLLPSRVGYSGGDLADLGERPFHLPDIERIIVDVEKQIERDKRKDLNSWLDASWTTDLYDNLNQRRLAGTCGWILNCIKVQNWISLEFPDTNPKVLWLNGGPGSGKTMLCASLVHQLSTIQYPLAYHFISSDTNGRKDPYMFVRSWISQIVSQNEVAFDLAYAKLGSNSRRPQTATQNEVLELLQAIVNSVPKCTFVVDGLDELAWESPGRSDDESPTSLLIAIRGAIVSTKTRLLVVSRDESTIRAGIYSNNVSVVPVECKIVPEDVNADIASYSKNIVDTKLANKPEQFRGNISQKIADRCDGMFLWAKMLGDELRGSKSQIMLERLIDRTPTALHSLYDKNWARICSQGENDRNRAFSVLRWTVHAFRPLTIEELTEALLVTEDVGDDEDDSSVGNILRDEYPDAIDQKYVDDDIINLCGSLVEIRQLQGVEDLASMSIHPIHFSARQYILQNLPYPSLVLNGQFYSSTGSIHDNILAGLCLRYISSRSVWLEPDESEAVKYRFKNYAATMWDVHVSPDCEGYTRILPLINAFFSPTGTNWDSWSKWLNRPKAVPNASPLFYASFLSLSDTVAHLIQDHSMNVNDNKGNNGTALHGAALYGHMDLVNSILAKGADVNITDNQNRTPLHLASEEGHISMVRALIDNGACLEIKDRDGNTPLMVAVYDGHVDVVNALLNNGADVMATCNNGDTSLHYVSHKGHVATAKLLLSSGADHGVANNQGRTPLLLSAVGGSVGVANLLLDAGANLEVRDELGDTPLHRAAKGGYVEVVKLFLDAGADKDTANKEGWTPLIISSRKGHNDVVALLLQRDADMTRSCRKKLLPITWAAAGGHANVVKLLLVKGADVGTDMLSSPLVYAARYGHIELVRLFLKHGTDPDLIRVSLNAAARKGHVEAARVLIDAADDVAKDPCWWMEPLMYAAKNDHLDVARLFLKRGASVDASYDHGLTPLLVAASNGSTGVARLLIEHHANVNATNNDGHTPLQIATFYHHHDVVELLVRNGADTTMSSMQGVTPLIVAVAQGNAKTVELFLDNGIDARTIVYPQSVSVSLLNMAADWNHAEVAKLLLDKGADQAVANNLGWTPLITAANPGHVEVTKVLLGHGISKSILNMKDGEKGQTALSHAVSEGRQEVTRLLITQQEVDLNSGDEAERSPLCHASIRGQADCVKLLLDTKKNKLLSTAEIVLGGRRSGMPGSTITST